ncbi:putative BRCT domain-containing protein [Helianthus anomalus]
MLYFYYKYKIMDLNNMKLLLCAIFQTMVELMGAQVSKPLIATKVTHLICYKFEGVLY